MLEELQSRLPMFRTRLTETVVWCLSQSLESNPAESAEIKKRRRLGEEAGKLSIATMGFVFEAMCSSALRQG